MAKPRACRLPELSDWALTAPTMNGMDEESLASPEVLTSLSQALSNLVLGDNEIRTEYAFDLHLIMILVTPMCDWTAQRRTSSHRKVARNPARAGYLSARATRQASTR